MLNRQIFPFMLLVDRLRVEQHRVNFMMIKQFISNPHDCVEVGKFGIVLKFMLIEFRFVCFIEDERTRLRMWSLIIIRLRTHEETLLLLYLHFINLLNLLLILPSPSSHHPTTSFNFSILTYLQAVMIQRNRLKSAIKIIKLMKQKFCLNSVASFKQINGSSMNNSRTKQTFSFSKTPRFQAFRAVCQKSTYGGDYVLHKISGAGIGYGIKSDFTKTSTVSPGCTKYNLVSEFEDNKKKLRGSSVGLSRDAVAFNQYISKESIKMPDSTKYQHEKFSKFSSPSYSLRQKTILKDRSMTLDPQRMNPGPGTYQEPKDSKVSKFSYIAYGTSRSHRFLSHENGVPGAGHYQNEEPISNKGKYTNSKHFGGTQAKFGKSTRATFLDEAAKGEKSKPGPGFYKSPSQFGQYDGDVYSNQTALGRFSRKT